MTKKIVFILSLFFAPCSHAELVQQQVMDLADYSEVVVNGNIDVVILPGRPQQMNFYADSNDKTFEYTCSNGRLALYYQPVDDQRIKVELYQGSLNQISLNGRYSLTADIYPLSPLTVKTQGVGTVYLQGKTNQLLSLYLRGQTWLDAKRFKAEDIVFDADGLTRAKIFLSGKLTKQTYGLTDLKIYGKSDNAVS